MGLVLVTDASERAALAVISRLVRKAIKVMAADATGFNAGFLSNTALTKCARRALLMTVQRFRSVYVFRD